MMTMQETIDYWHDKYIEKTKQCNDLKSQRDVLLKACKDVDKWLQNNTKASNRPAYLDKQLIDAIRQAKSTNNG